MFSLPSNLSPEELRASLARDGYVRIPHAISGETLDRYRDAAAAATELARAGQWPFVRTMPQEFPPWRVVEDDGGRAPEIWGVQHLLHPAWPPALRRVFAESYFDPALVGLVAGVLRCAPGALGMELYNLLVRPERDFALRWHRDEVAATATAAEEEERLGAGAGARVAHAQWNLALYEDSSLVVVPGSQGRARTAAERAAAATGDMPGQTVVRLAPGDLLLYDNNILHRGVYDCRRPRLTLHGSMGVAGAEPARARNILRHGVGAWAARCDFGALPGEMAEQAAGMQRRLIAMGGGEGAEGLA